jgi:serine/threonine-protein kinase
MVTAGGEVKVLDFGIAHSVDAAAITRSTTVLGTAAYMAPEQALGRRTDARSDIYSLGCVLYAMLAGHPPFSGELPVAVLHQHANAAPPSLRAINPAVSPALEALVMRMLAKSPDDRPQSAREVRDDLTAMAAGLGTAATAPLAAVMPTAATRAMAPASPPRPRRPAAPTRPLRSASPLPPPGTSRLLSGPALAVAIALLLAAIIAIALTSGGGGKSPAGAVGHSSSITTTRSTPTTSSTPTTTSSSTTTSTPSTTSSSSTTTSSSTTPGPPIPGSGGVPPGHSKKPKGPGKKGKP